MKTTIGRLALRVEGEWWNAYYATTDNMNGAIRLGSIQLRLACYPSVKTSFMKTMTLAVGAIIKEATGLEPEWRDPESAPEHERSGSA